MISSRMKFILIKKLSMFMNIEKFLMKKKIDRISEEDFMIIDFQIIIIIILLKAIIIIIYIIKEMQVLMCRIDIGRKKVRKIWVKEIIILI